jgi:hypothetical protein
LASIFGVVDVCDFPAVDSKMALGPGGDIDFKLLIANGCNEFLHGGAFAEIYLIAAMISPIDLNQARRVLSR